MDHYAYSNYSHDPSQGGQYAAQGGQYPAQGGQQQYQYWPQQPTQGGMAAWQGMPAQASSYGWQPRNVSSSNDRFLKGLLIGAAAAYLLTNESVQRTAIKGAVKAWSLLQGGVEELKERFQDAEAEVRAEGGE